MKKISLLALIYFSSSISNFIPAQGAWTRKADFGGGPAYLAVGFSIGTKGYIGTSAGCVLGEQFWEYDPDHNTWTQKADFGGGPRCNAVGFSIGNKGYIGTGQEQSGSYKNDFWEYDPASNNWTQKSSFPGTVRARPIGFCAFNKGYIGLGVDGNGSRDLWEYDPATNSWHPKPNFPGAYGSNDAWFSVYNAAYSGINDWNSFWRFDASNDSWTQLSNFPGSARSLSTAFSVAGCGYLATGCVDTALHTNPFLTELWRYAVASNTWSRMADLPAVPRWGAVSFSIGNSGYLGTGYNPDTMGMMKDFWKFDPNATSVIDYPEKIPVTVFPNPMHSSAVLKLESMLTDFHFMLFDVSGKKLRDENITGTQLIIGRGNLEAGVYFYNITSGEKQLASGKLIVE